MDTVEMSLCELDLQFYFVTADGRPAQDQSDLACCFEVSTPACVPDKLCI